ncbi:sigma-70 family RNA polymerase sigma factor [Rossellomorea vietnamensis]|uniref:Sigma-70 family RNA polymerase sigma factor n=1 Tax=Rossellomorea aquimaris TaxID=189382 RepID=A0A5D4UA71_9BACI|nr:sigma-70 family RNA polymerase sigma factor [Rossellomorea aquimaris]TYS84277.1 sigma-70 family RNA polymerase sigma factor [Rossellomorea aquimaris]
MDESFANQEEFLDYIFEHFSDDVYRLNYTYVKNREVAEDLVQEVFLKCYRNFDKFNGDSSLKTWVIRIAINQCKDYIKSAYAKYVLLSNKIVELSLGESKSAEEIVLDSYGNTDLTENIMKLPLKYREIVFLHYYHNLKIREISLMLNIKENTVKSRMTRAKELLKKAYHEKGGITYGEETKTT